MDEAELVRQAMAGKGAAYEQLVRQWAARVLALCHARVGRADVAEDLCQEALMRGWRALGTLADANKFGPWVCGIATRVCLDWLNSAQRSEVPMSVLRDSENAAAFSAAAAADEAGSPEHQDEVRSMMEEVERLPLEYRQVVMLFYYDQCTYQQIADTLQVSAATVNARLTKARATLRRRMSRSPQAKAADRTNLAAAPKAGTAEKTHGL